MDSIETYFSDERILHYLCRYRARIAKSRNRRHLIYRVSRNSKVSPHDKPEGDALILSEILPKRRSWIKLKPAQRTGPDGQPINAQDKNIRSLILTVRRDRRHRPSEPYLARLDGFCNEVRAILDEGRPLSTPQIRPQCKDFKHAAEKNICRPIASYPMSEAIAICLTNQYFTKFLDCLFESCSFAFRSPIIEKGKRKKVTHHDAFQQIIDYCEEYRTKQLWVAECDIRKFYDTVNHTIVKKAFRRLIAQASRYHEKECDDKAIRLFYSYLDSYKFNKTVWPLNDSKHGHFKEKCIRNGIYDWPIDEFSSLAVYRSFNNAKIGIPQGGALSGLISNIVLHSVDKMIMKNADGRLLYVRYCDDMILIHPKRTKCKQLIGKYENALRKRKLLPHSLVNVLPYGRHFWEQKSKVPYKWDQDNGCPWIGFVGYEINRDGHIRVRKKSLKKEMQKQYDTIRQVLDALHCDCLRASNRSIRESLTNRLIQMAIGKVGLHNYALIPSEHCWVGGFHLLNRNKHSEIQMRRLDACRCRLISVLERRLQNVSTKGVILTNTQNRQILFYGKPFSYYYHALEKQQPSDSEIEGI